MVQPIIEFNLFHFLDVDRKKDGASYYIDSVSDDVYGKIFHLQPKFFTEKIASSISPTSSLHDIYAYSIPPSEYCTIRDSFNKNSPSEKDTTLMNRHMHVQMFLERHTSHYNPYSTVYRTLSSCTFSLFIFMRKKKEPFDTLGFVFYRCDPCIGLIIPFIYVERDYRCAGVGAAMMQTLQFLCQKNLNLIKTLVWITKTEGTKSDKLLSYYRSLGFVPTLPENFPISHMFPSDLVASLHSCDPNAHNVSKDFLLQRTDIIRKQDELQLNPGLTSYFVCSLCGIQYREYENMVICQYELPKSKIIWQNSKDSRNRRAKKTHVCGVVLCHICHSNFGCSLLNRCPMHHNKKPATSKKTRKKNTRTTAEMNEFKSIKKSYNFMRKLYDDKDYVTFYQGHNPVKKDEKNISKYCTHCSMINSIGSNISLNCVSQSKVLPKKDEWNYLKFTINNSYDYQHLSWMEKIGLTKEVACPFSGNKKYEHPLVFRSNSGKPISLLTNKIFAIRTLSAHGDCGILCIMYAIHFSKKYTKKILETIGKYISRQRTKFGINIQKDNLMDVSEFRHLLLLSRLDTSENIPETIRDQNRLGFTPTADELNDEEKEDYYIKLQDAYKLFKKSEEIVIHYTKEMEAIPKREKQARNEYQKKMITPYKNEMKSVYTNLKRIFCRSAENYDANNVHWLTDQDFLNVPIFTNFLVGVIYITDEQHPSKNNQSDFIHDFGFRLFYDTPILKKCKYIMVIRHLCGMHFDLLYDRMRCDCLFDSKDRKDPTSAVSIILGFASPKKRFELTGEDESWEKSYGLAKESNDVQIPNNFFTGNPPSYEKWINTLKGRNHHIFDLVREKFTWFGEKKKIDEIVSQNGMDYNQDFLKTIQNKMICVILDKNSTEEKQYDVINLGYILQMKGRNVFLDIKGCMMSEIEYSTESRKNSWRYALPDDFQRILHKFSFYIFQDRVHSIGIFQSDIRELIQMSFMEKMHSPYWRECLKTLSLKSDSVPIKKLLFLLHKISVVEGDHPKLDYQLFWPNKTDSGVEAYYEKVAKRVNNDIKQAMNFTLYSKEKLKETIVNQVSVYNKDKKKT